MKRFVAYYHAHRYKCGTLIVASGILLCHCVSDGEALGKGYLSAMEAFPNQEGWSMPTVSVVELTQEWFDLDIDAALLARKETP